MNQRDRGRREPHANEVRGADMAAFQDAIAAANPQIIRLDGLPAVEAIIGRMGQRFVGRSLRDCVCSHLASPGDDRIGVWLPDHPERILCLPCVMPVQLASCGTANDHRCDHCHADTRGDRIWSGTQQANVPLRTAGAASRTVFTVLVMYGLCRNCCTARVTEGVITALP